MELGVLGSAQSLHVAPSTESTCLLGEIMRMRVPVCPSERNAFWQSEDDDADDDDDNSDDVCFSAAYANDTGRRKRMGGKQEESLPHPFPCDRMVPVVYTTCYVQATCSGQRGRRFRCRDSSFNSEQTLSCFWYIEPYPYCLQSVVQYCIVALACMYTLQARYAGNARAHRPT